MIPKGRKCCICESSNTYVNKMTGISEWRRFYDEKGIWNGKSYLCKNCYNNLESLKTKKIKENRLKNRKCCICESNKTGKHFSGTPNWYNHKCDKYDCTGHICDRCYPRIRNDLPITITKNLSRPSIYDQFKVDNKPYNDIYHDLLSYLKDKSHFNIEDIKEWLKM